MKAEIIEEMEQAMKESEAEKAKAEKQSVLPESAYEELAEQQADPDLIDELAATAQDREEFKKAQAKVKEIVRSLKRQFKGLSKTQLIHIIVEQISRAEQYQMLAKQYYEDNLKLIAELEGENENNQEDS